MIVSLRAKILNWLAKLAFVNTLVYLTPNIPTYVPAFVPRALLGRAAVPIFVLPPVLVI